MEPRISNIRHHIMSYFRIHDEPDQNKGLWGIALTSYFWSCSSLMVFSLLPAFLIDAFGASKTQVGFIEGWAIFMMFVSKVFSGVLSDYLRSRKGLIILGSFLNIIIKPMFAFAGSVMWIFWARFIDRLSRGIRAAPTDALIADFSANKKPGASFGVRQTCYTLGAVSGAALASLIMFLSSHNYRLTFALSIVPAILALLTFVTLVKNQPEVGKDQNSGKVLKWDMRDIKLLPTNFWIFLCATSILMLARFSEAFLSLRAKESGISLVLLPVILVMNELMHSFVALPSGKLADRMNRFSLLLYGIIVLVVTNFVMIFIPNTFGALLGVTLAGLHMGITQPILATLVADSTPPHLRGSAFAIFYCVCGSSVLLGNLIAGRLADYHGLSGAFIGGAFFSSMACIVIAVFILPRTKRKGNTL